MRQTTPGIFPSGIHRSPPGTASGIADAAREKTALCGEDSEKNRMPCSDCHLVAGLCREANIVQYDDDGLGVSCLGDNCSEWANRV
jgi:hypothetical protein